MNHISLKVILATMILVSAACGADLDIDHIDDTVTLGEAEVLIFYYGKPRCTLANKCSLEQGHWLDFEEQAESRVYIGIEAVDGSALPTLSFSSEAPSVFDVEDIGCDSLTCDGGKNCQPSYACDGATIYFVGISSISVGTARLLVHDGATLVDTALIEVRPSLSTTE